MLARLAILKILLPTIIQTFDLLEIPNPFSWDYQQHNKNKMDIDVVNDDDNKIAVVPHRPNPNCITQTWTKHCLPRFTSVLNMGAGHAIYHDVHWATRHGRIASLLKSLATSNNGDDNNDDEDNKNFGPHLIVTVQPEMHNFCQEFRDLNGRVSLVLPKDGELQVLPYQGTKAARRKLRCQYFPQANYGLPESSFHVMVTTYSNFLEDYLHFCQIPFECVILDDSQKWMSAASIDSNSAIGSIWENGMWSHNDQQTGLAGTSTIELGGGGTSAGVFGGIGVSPTTIAGGLGIAGAGSGGDLGSGDQWDFSIDGYDIPESKVKEAWVGLTARHRIMTSSSFSMETGNGSSSSSSRSASSTPRPGEVVPVSGLVSFVAPHFADLVREEWDRSRIASDVKSMDHFRQLVARSTIVHYCDEGEGSNSSS